MKFGIEIMALCIVSLQLLTPLKVRISILYFSFREKYCVRIDNPQSHFQLKVSSNGISIILLINETIFFIGLINETIENFYFAGCTFVRDKDIRMHDLQKEKKKVINTFLKKIFYFQFHAYFQFHTFKQLHSIPRQKAKLGIKNQIPCPILAMSLLTPDLVSTLAIAKLVISFDLHEKI